MRLAAVLETPSGWSRNTGPGFVLHREPPTDVRLAFAEAVARGLEDYPRTLPCTYLYDGAGSEIFERITEQPEYYQTRTENRILEEQALSLRSRAGDSTVVELGSGSSSKTRSILAAWCRQAPTRYVPIDVSGDALESACIDLTERFDCLTVEALATTYERGLPLAARLSPLMLIFLGSTIGNFNHAELDRFLDMLAGQLQPDDRLLLGVDRIKRTDRIESAYNDAAGWSARFTTNLFDRMNRELGTAIPANAVEHVAFYNEQLARIEIYARFRQEVIIDIALLGRRFRMAPGEMVRTEISRKFQPDHVATNLNRFGFTLENTVSDEADLFSVLMFRRRRETPFADNRRRFVQSLLRRVRSKTLDLLSPLEGLSAPLPDAIQTSLTRRLEDLARHEVKWLVAAVDSEQAELGEVNPAAGSAPAVTPGPSGGEIDAHLLYLAAVRRETMKRLSFAPLDAAQQLSGLGRLHLRVAQREAQAHELIVEALESDFTLAYEPVDEGTPPARPDHSPAGDSLLIPACPFPMGRDQAAEAMDDEQPQHSVDLGPYFMDAAPVTNGEYLEFMEDGGYRRPELWSKAGWEWAGHQEHAAPGAWFQEDDTWRLFHLGSNQVMDPARPVCHVSWFEAEAWARWAGRRLPSEAEWEKAASWNPERNISTRYPWGDTAPTAEHANLGQNLWQPVPVGSFLLGRSFYGCHQMIGDVWEWTGSPYAPYPGYEQAHPDSPASHRFGTGLHVLRGGSWATTPAAVTSATRRAAAPGDKHMFTGFRCARDI